MKICNTKDLVTLCHTGTSVGMNRQTCGASVRDIADPEGTHLLVVVLPYHNGIRAKQGPHHRVQVYMKTEDTVEPTTFIVDVLASQYDELTDAIMEEGKL